MVRVNERGVVQGESVPEGTGFAILSALSFSHFLNDMLQSLVPALYPMLRVSYGLSFAQIGFITLAFQLTASLLQPLVGAYTDRRPLPYSLSVGMGFTGTGLLLLASADRFAALLCGAALIGMGSSVFHPESSRVARLASGGRHGLAQSFFQVGGNAGSATGPLLAAFIVVPRGQSSVAWFALAALLAIVVLANVGAWYKGRMRGPGGTSPARAALAAPVERKRIGLAITVLLILIFSKYFYLASLTSYYTLYLIDRFHVSVQSAQLHLFVFLGAVATGTFVGGPVGDRIGRKRVIWGSILGVLPFTLLLPHADLTWTGILTVPIGLILASAFSAILVYAQELVPGRVGMIAGLFFGFAFGVAGLGAAVLGAVADHQGIAFVYRLCAYLPALGILAALLPDMDDARRRGATVTSESPARL
jgi:MFS transporter, FSR family, fosmidomycin resistance protein